MVVEYLMTTAPVIEGRTEEMRAMVKMGRARWMRRESERFRLTVLSGMLRPALEQMCRELRITGYSRMNKDQLKEAILAAKFQNGVNATVTYETADAVYRCSQLTHDTLTTVLEGTPTPTQLTTALFALLDEALANGGLKLLTQDVVLAKMQEGKQRFGWCSTADQTIRDMGINTYSTRHELSQRSIDPEHVKRIAQQAGDRSGYTPEVNILLRELNIPV